MEGTENFKEAIKNYLRGRALEDSLFKASIKKENKSIEDCIKYILNTVSKQKVNGLADQDVFNIAVHYYDEDDIDVGGDIKCKVLVNHYVELTAEEIEEVKKLARLKIFREQEQEMQKKKDNKRLKAESKTDENTTLTLQF